MPRAGKVQIGADPEFEWYRGNSFIPANQICNSLTAKLGADGSSATGEMRPKYGSCGSVMRSINKILDKAVTLGDYAIYAGSGKSRPLGGHIHFSGVTAAPTLVTALDKFLTIPLNEVSDRHIRSDSSYGRLGDHRDQPWGWEYRAAPSWIVHPVIARGVLRIAYTLAIAYDNGRLGEIQSFSDLVKYAAVADTTSKCSVKDLHDYDKMLKRMKVNGIKLENIDVLQAWKKRPRLAAGEIGHPTKTTFIPRLSWNTEDENVREVQIRYENLIHNKIEVDHKDIHYKDGYSFRIVGAAAHRTNDDVVFVPSMFLIPWSRVPDHVLQWEINAIGMSVTMRTDPQIAAERLFNLLYTEETVNPIANNDNRCLEMLNKIEGRI